MNFTADEIRMIDLFGSGFGQAVPIDKDLLALQPFGLIPAGASRCSCAISEHRLFACRKNAVGEIA